MAKVQVQVTSKVTAYWVAIDDHDVEITNGQGADELSAGEHFLTWWMVGQSGKGISITLSEGAKELVSITSAIPAGYSTGAGSKRFQA